MDLVVIGVAELRISIVCQDLFVEDIEKKVAGPAN